MNKKLKSAVFYFAAIVGLCVVLTTFTRTSFSGQRGWPGGNNWRAWSKDAKEKYIWGYMSGSGDAYDAACRQIDLEWAGKAEPGYENSPLNKCLKGQLDFSKGSDYFLKSLTEFYEAHPEDRDISIGEVLDLLGKGFTVNELHKHSFQGHKPTGEQR